MKHVERFRFSFSSVSSQNLKQTKAKRVGLKAGCLLQLHLHSMAPARGRVRTNREMRTDDAVQILAPCKTFFAGGCCILYLNWGSMTYRRVSTLRGRKNHSIWMAAAVHVWSGFPLQHVHYKRISAAVYALSGYPLQSADIPLQDLIAFRLVFGFQKLDIRFSQRTYRSRLQLLFGQFLIAFGFQKIDLK